MDIKYTCIACRVGFRDPDIQRQHYKSDWHRYNLKRKVAEFPPVTAEEFQRRVLLQREQDNAESKPNTAYCAICKKVFSTLNSYNNHLNSKKHKVAEESNISNSPPQTNGVIKGKLNDKNVESDIETDSDVEEVDSDEWEESEDNPIESNNCLFCSHHSSSMIKNIKHMTVAHSFFIPDVEYIVDMKGLLGYLGEKVSKYYMCLWCNDRGRSFYSMEAAQQHMVDKGHCKMLHEGEALAEYAQYYDYSSSYPDHTEGVDLDEEVAVSILDDSDFELVLPSGARVGHRSLMRYYRQSLDPSKAVVHQKKIHRVMAQYRALGWTETQKEQATRKARDLRYMNRAKSRFYTAVGIKANKLQQYCKNQSLNF